MKSGMPYPAFGTALLSAALFGAATPFSKFLLTELHPNQLAGLLYLGAALFLLPHMAGNRARGHAMFPADRRNRLNLLGAVIFGGVVGPVLLLIGLRMALAASVSMWLNLETVATGIFAAMWFKEQMGRFAWAGNAGILACGLLLSLNEGWSGFLAMAFVAGAAISWGLDNNFTAVIDAISPQTSTFWKGLAAGTTNLAAGLALFGIPADAPWLWGLGLGAVSYGLSISLYIAAAQRMGAARSQMVFAGAPFFGVLFSVSWLGESMSVLQILAGIILALSLLMLFLERHRHYHEHEPMEHQHTHRHDEPHHAHPHPGEVPGAHSHVHVHGALRHSHPHWPDLHHRHRHPRHAEEAGETPEKGAARTGVQPPANYLQTRLFSGAEPRT